MYCVCLILTCLAIGEFSDEQAEAVLAGIESHRNSIESYVAEYDVRTIIDGNTNSSPLSIEYSSAGQRYESDKTFGILVVRRGERLDLHRKVISNLDINTSSHTGEFAFDARILGLEDMQNHELSVSKCLWLEHKGNQFSFESGVSLNGSSLAKIRIVQAGGATKEMWVDPTSFRVHRVEIRFRDIVSDIESEYLPSNNGPYPDRVKILRTEKDDFVRLNVELTKRRFEEVKIDPERFEPISMEIPVNTMVFDRRINKYLGYWNGTDYFNSSPEYDVQEISQKNSSNFFYYYVTGGALLLAALGWAVVRYHRK